MTYPAAPAPTSPEERGVGQAQRGGLLRTFAGPLIVLFVAAVSRLAVLGYPPKLVFDETFYVKDAWSLWHLGYEGSWTDPATGPKVNELFESGRVDVYSSTASFPAHPPLGKWLMGLGEVAAGGADNSIGWRLSVAIAGILGVALLMWVAHRLFATPIVTTVAGGLFAIDNQAIVLSRVGLLDNFVMLFALIGFALVLEDRRWAERRFASWLLRPDPGAFGPLVLWRPWLIGAGAAFGLCCGVKWSGLYFLAAFMVYVVLADLMLRRRAGVRLWPAGTALKQVPVVALSMLPSAVVAYLVCWTGWFVTDGGYDRNYVEDGGQRFTGLFAWVPVPLQNLLAWHREIYAFHVGLSSPHPYQAPAILWPLIARPTSMWYLDPDQGATCLGDAHCVSAITDLPNPLIWYASIAATIYLLVRFVRRREWQAGLILVGTAAGYLPWLLYPNRTIFFFYSIAFEPYLILALAATVGLLVARPPDLEVTDDGDSEAAYGLAVRRRLVGVLLAVAVVLSLFFYPISAAIPVPYWFWHIHMWSPTWI